MRLLSGKYVTFVLFTALLSVVFLLFIAPCMADSSRVVGIAQANGFSLMLKDDGTVWYWGLNHGLHGDGSMENKDIPSLVPIDNVVKISAKVLDAIALKKDGTVWTWGSNFYGTRGDGTIRPTPQETYLLDADLSSRPYMVQGLSGVVDVESTGMNCFAIKNDGTVWAWGTNYYGSLGDGESNNSFVPVQVTNLSNVKSICGDGAHTLALDDHGNVWAWGANGFGELGDGTTKDHYTPEKVSIDHVKSIFAGNRVSFAVKDDGSVWAWGCGRDGVLGNNATNVLTPIKIAGINNITALAPDKYPILAVSNDGRLLCWGYYGESSYQMEWDEYNGSYISNKFMMANVINVVSSNDNSLMLKTDGSVWSQGGNQYGQRGVGWEDNDSGVPCPVNLYLPSRVLTELAITPSVSAIATNTVSNQPSATATNTTHFNNDPLFEIIAATLGLIVAGGSVYSFLRKRK